MLSIATNAWHAYDKCFDLNWMPRKFSCIINNSRGYFLQNTQQKVMENEMKWIPTKWNKDRSIFESNTNANRQTPWTVAPLSPPPSSPTTPRPPPSAAVYTSIFNTINVENAFKPPQQTDIFSNMCDTSKCICEKSLPFNRHRTCLLFYCFSLWLHAHVCVYFCGY